MSEVPRYWHLQKKIRSLNIYYDERGKSSVVSRPEPLQKKILADIDAEAFVLVTSIITRETD